MAGVDPARAGFETLEDGPRFAPWEVAPGLTVGAPGSGASLAIDAEGTFGGGGHPRSGGGTD